MSETIDISKPLCTKRGGLVTQLHQTSNNGNYPLIGIEIFQGEPHEKSWMANGMNWDDGSWPDNDLTHTNPNPPAPQPAPDKPAYELLFSISPGNDIVIGNHTLELKRIEDGKAMMKVTYHGEYSK